MAKETISSFHSEIVIQQNSSMLVTETIRVNAEHVNIKRGIYRDFPTRYKDRLGHNYVTGFKVISVIRNGRQEPYHMVNQSNGVRVYIGNKNNYIPKKEHNYKIIYETTRQLGYFDKHDELYWNVTGNGWRFPILKASAQVSLPDYVDTSMIRTEGYTGLQGSQEKALTVNVLDGKNIYFETTRTLRRNEGLSIVLGWPKGLVTKPGFDDRLNYFLDDNPNAIAGLLGMLLVFSFYYSIWHGVGRDRLSPVMFPNYKPPKNFSPAACRYLMRMDYDKKTFATAIIALAIKGYLKITKPGDDYNLIKRKAANKTDMAAGEYALFTQLFKAYTTVPLSTTYHATISAAIEKHKKSLRANYHKIYFITNRLWLLLGVMLSVLCLMVFFSYTGNIIQAESINFLGLILVLALFPLSHFFSMWFPKLSPNITSATKKTMIAFGIATGIYIVLPIPFMFVFVISSIITMNFVFYELLKAPTRAGKPIIEKLLGLRHYLEIAEGDDINLKYAPELTPETFEYFFPYAMALDVEQAWGARFAALFATLAQSGQAYSPGWNDGISHRDFTNSGGFNSSFSDSLTSSISSSSVAPGSSSGGGGGGGSGGGGGGGGGGGW